MKIYNSSISVDIVRKYKKLFPDAKINVLRSFAVLDNDVALLCKRFRPHIGGPDFRFRNMDAESGTIGSGGKYNS